MRSIFYQLPSCNLFTQHVRYLYGETPLVNCGPRSNSITLIKPQTANCSFFIRCNLILIFHTRRLILCFQQAGEIDNLTVSLGQSTVIVLCVQVHVGDRVAPCEPPTTFWRIVTPTGSINLGFILRENLLLGYIKPSSWGLPTSKYVLHQAFFWRRCQGDNSLLQGEFHTSNLFTFFCLA